MSGGTGRDEVVLPFPDGGELELEAGREGDRRPVVGVDDEGGGLSVGAQRQMVG